MFAEFTTQTSIRGFVHASKAKNVREKCMWYLIIAITAGLTCWDVHDSLVYFLSNPTTTKISVLDNMTISFEQPTICLPFQTYFENVNEMNAQSVPQLLDEMWPRVFLQNNSDEVAMDDQMVKFLSLSLAVLTSISRAQYVGALPAKFPHIYTWGFANGYRMEGYDHVKSAAVWFQDNNVKMTTLMQIAGELLCNFSRISIKRLTTRNQTRFTCSRSRVSWVGLQPVYPNSDFFCMYLPSDLFAFSTIADITQFKADFSPQFRTKDFSTISIDLSGQQLISLRSQNTLWISVGSAVSVQIQIFARYKHLNRPTQRCTSHNPAQPICLMNRLQEYIKNWCNCAPFPFPNEFNSENLPDCNVDILNSTKSINSSKCLLIQREFPDENISFAKCFSRCEYHVISYFHVPIVSEGNNGTLANFFVDPYKFPMIEEFFLIGPKQFLGSLGGNLSLYLGASFVALFHAFYFWTSNLFTRLMLFGKSQKTDSVS